MLALQQWFDKIKHLGLRVGVEGDEEPSSLLLPCVENLRLDVLQVRHLDPIQLVEVWLFFFVIELIFFIHDFLGSILEIVDFKLLLLVKGHLSQKFPPFFVSHMRIFVKSMTIFLLCMGWWLRIFLLLNKRRQSKTAKLIFHPRYQLFILYQSIQLPCNSSILTPNHICLEQALHNIGRQITHIANRRGDQTQLPSNFPRLDIFHDTKAKLAPAPDHQNYFLNV